jgi:hypothetical protein
MDSILSDLANPHYRPFFLYGAEGFVKQAEAGCPGYSMKYPGQICD